MGHGVGLSPSIVKGVQNNEAINAEPLKTNKKYLSLSNDAV